MMISNCIQQKKLANDVYSSKMKKKKKKNLKDVFLEANNYP